VRCVGKSLCEPTIDSMPIKTSPDTRASFVQLLDTAVLSSVVIELA
jgi:hypothetical protein